MLATRRLKGLDGVHTNDGAYVFIYLGIYVCEESSRYVFIYLGIYLGIYLQEGVQV